MGEFWGEQILDGEYLSAHCFSMLYHFIKSKFIYNLSCKHIYFNIIKVYPISTVGLDLRKKTGFKKIVL